MINYQTANVDGRVVMNSGEMFYENIIGTINICPKNDNP
jgi:hypothetical protein